MGWSMIFDDIWWYLMIFDDIWWYLMIFDDIWWYLMIFDDIWWYLMIFDDIWWYLMIFDDIWWYLMIFDDIWWYLMIFDDIWWLLEIQPFLDVSTCFLWFWAIPCHSQMEMWMGSAEGPQFAFHHRFHPETASSSCLWQGDGSFFMGKRMVVGCSIFGKIPIFEPVALKNNPVAQQTRRLPTAEKRCTSQAKMGSVSPDHRTFTKEQYMGRLSARKLGRPVAQNRLRTGKTCFAVPTSFNSSVVELAQNHLSF